MKVALIFEMIPEDIYFYIIDDPSDDDLRILKGANGKYINSDESDELEILCDMIVDPEHCDDPDSDVSCKWIGNKVELSELSKPGVKFDAVYVCGFIM